MEMFRQRHTLSRKSMSCNTEGCQKDGPISNQVQNSRRSVIQPNNLQSNYSVPIANSFNTLGNLFVKTSALVGMIVFIVNIPQLSNITYPTTITLMCLLLKLVNLFFQPFPLLRTKWEVLIGNSHLNKAYSVQSNSMMGWKFLSLAGVLSMMKIGLPILMKIVLPILTRTRLLRTPGSASLTPSFKRKQWLFCRRSLSTPALGPSHFHL